MEMNQEIEKGDVILSNGRTYRVLSVFKPDGEIKRIDGIDDSEESPLRRTIWAKDINKLLRKGPKLQAQPEPNPEGKVVEKEPIPAALKKDIEERERHTTSSAEAGRKNQAQAGRK